MLFIVMAKPLANKSIFLSIDLKQNLGEAKFFKLVTQLSLRLG